MKRIIFVMVLGLLSAEVCVSQAVLGKVEYQKSQQPAAVIELPYPPEVVEGAIKDHMGKKGSKPDQSKGFTGYKNVQLSLADASSSDVYFKIDRKSRKEDNVSVVYMLVTRKDENPATRSSEDSHGIDQAQAFLNDFTPKITSYNLELQIKQQDEEVKKAQKKLDNLVDEGRDIEKRKKNLEEKLTENAQNQEKQKMEIEKQRTAQEELIRRRL